MKKEKCKVDRCRLNKVGGQAVLEGVMMKAGDRTVTSCRKDDGSIVVNDATFVSLKKKNKFFNIPIIRGVVGFVESLVLSIKTLNASAEVLGLDEPDEKAKAKREKKIAEGKLDPNKQESHAVTNAVMVIATILGLVLSVVLFMYLPSLAADGIDWLFTNPFGVGPLGDIWLAVIEGVMKVIIFITYLWLVSLMPDIRRTFQYHGAEHKSIACFESGEELTPENARKHRRFHPRCGTSFMFLMILIGIFVGMFVRFILPDGVPSIIIALVKLALLPITMGVGYEILMLAGRFDNVFTRIISAPGLWVQRITTKEPDDSQLEIAITSIKCALRDEFDEFREFYESRGWEKKEESDGEASADAEVMSDADAATDEMTVSDGEISTEDGGEEAKE